MKRLFPRPDSLCLNFGKTAVFQWNDLNSSTLKHTTAWPQQIAGDSARLHNQGGITQIQMDLQPQMPYVILRNVSPHFDTYANSKIPGIQGMADPIYKSRTNKEGGEIAHQVRQFLHLLPHLQRNDMGKTGALGTEKQDSWSDLQALEMAILSRAGRRYV